MMEWKNTVCSVFQHLLHTIPIYRFLCHLDTQYLVVTTVVDIKLVLIKRVAPWKSLRITKVQEIVMERATKPCKNLLLALSDSLNHFITGCYRVTSFSFPLKPFKMACWPALGAFTSEQRHPSAAVTDMCVDESIFTFYQFFGNREEYAHFRYTVSTAKLKSLSATWRSAERRDRKGTPPYFTTCYCSLNQAGGDIACCFRVSSWACAALPILVVPISLEGTVEEPR